MVSGSRSIPAAKDGVASEWYSVRGRPHKNYWREVGGVLRERDLVAERSEVASEEVLEEALQRFKLEGTSPCTSCVFHVTAFAKPAPALPRPMRSNRASGESDVLRAPAPTTPLACPVRSATARRAFPAET